MPTLEDDSPVTDMERENISQLEKLVSDVTAMDMNSVSKDAIRCALAASLDSMDTAISGPKEFMAHLDPRRSETVTSVKDAALFRHGFAIPVSEPSPVIKDHESGPIIQRVESTFAPVQENIRSVEELKPCVPSVEDFNPCVDIKPPLEQVKSCVPPVKDFNPCVDVNFTFEELNRFVPAVEDFNPCVHEITPSASMKELKPNLQELKPSIDEVEPQVEGAIESPSGFTTAGSSEIAPTTEFECEETEDGGCRTPTQESVRWNYLKHLVAKLETSLLNKKSSSAENGSVNSSAIADIIDAAKTSLTKISSDVAAPSIADAASSSSLLSLASSSSVIADKGGRENRSKTRKKDSTLTNKNKVVKETATETAPKLSAPSPKDSAPKESTTKESAPTAKESSRKGVATKASKSRKNGKEAVEKSEESVANVCASQSAPLSRNESVIKDSTSKDVPKEAAGVSMSDVALKEKIIREARKNAIVVHPKPANTPESLKKRVNSKSIAVDFDQVSSKGFGSTLSFQSRFFIIKSFCEDDIFASLKYSLWSSTDHGNVVLDEAYDSGKAVYLLYSVNKSGRFCGLARMKSAVNFQVRADIWANNGPWHGKFDVEWLVVKDIANNDLRSIRNRYLDVWLLVP